MKVSYFLMAIPFLTFFVGDANGANLNIPEYHHKAGRVHAPQSEKEMIDHIKSTVAKCRSMVREVEGKDRLFKKNPFHPLKQRNLWKQYNKLMKMMSYDDYLGHINDLKVISGKSQAKFIKKIKEARDFTKARNSVSEDLTVFAYNCKAPVDAIKSQVKQRESLASKK